MTDVAPANQPAEQELLEELREWVHEQWDPTLPLDEWRSILADSGWGCPTWPPEYCGRGLSPRLGTLVTEELRRHGVVGPASGVAMSLVAPTILAHGSATVKAAYLRPILTGEHKWCQLFSEPGSGSDLAGLTTRAERDGDEWSVIGQKVWNSGAQQAAYGILVARSDWDVPKHQGLTYFAIEMDQPGIEVRPLRQMNRHASFNEVFLDGARVHDRDRIGDQGDGWRVALTTLAHERGTTTSRRAGDRPVDAGRTVREAADEAAAYYETYRWYPQRAGRPDLVESLARANDRDGEPVLRQHQAALTAQRRAQQWNIGRVRAARAQGRPPGPEGSLAKLMVSDIARRSAEAHTLAGGPSGMLDGPTAPHDGLVAEVLVSTPAQSIAGGTDEIQRNIIGERTLGLPKEPSPERDAPFRDLRHNERAERTREASAQAAPSP